MPERLQVVVIGGSIAGLTLAHCLDHAGIDYMILEKHACIKAKVGGAIVISPNGARILDQLGLHDAVKAASETIKASHISFSDGHSLSQRWPSYVSGRLQYPFSVLTRQQLLEILHEKLNDKLRVKVQKRVVRICHESSGVSVSTEDGCTYYGDIVVGADGVHSTARSEMWRIARKAQSSPVIKDVKGFFADYRCVFGISHTVPGILPGDQIIKCGDGLTIFAFGGKDNLVGWCVVQRLHYRHYYPNVPRFQSAAAVALCESLANIRLRNETRFQDIWERRSSYVMTTLEEGMLRIWHHGRIVCIGDSINKMTPNIAQGANMAIESAAALANGLHHLIQASHPKRPSNNEINGVFEDLCRTLYPRARLINTFSQIVTRMFAQDGVKHTLFGRYIFLRSDYLTRLVMWTLLTRGVTLDYLPLGAAEGEWTQSNWVTTTNLMVLGFFSVITLWIVCRFEE